MYKNEGVRRLTAFILHSRVQPLLSSIVSLACLLSLPSLSIVVAELVIHVNFVQN